MAAVPCSPYTVLASVYDRTLGRRFLHRTARVWERIARRFGIVPRVVVDLGAGTGLFASWLARRTGACVYAVDASREMLDAGAAGRDPRVTPVWQDIRRLRLPEPVDLATANHDTINHLQSPSDVMATFRSVRTQLRPGGWFVFDVIAPPDPAAPPRVVVFRGPRTLMIQRVRVDRDRRSLHIAVTVSTATSHATERHRERLHDLSDIHRWLLASGFKVRALLDGDRAETLGATPPASRVVFVAQAAGSA